MGVLERDVSMVPSSDRDGTFTWAEHAACLGADVEVFFVSNAGHYGAARRICSRCPVIEECRAETDRYERTLPESHIYGFFAGETPRERFARRRGGGGR